MNRLTFITAAVVLTLTTVITGIVRGSSGAIPATTLPATTTTIPLAVWERPGELLVPPVVVLPTLITVSEGVVEIDYEYVPLSEGLDFAVRPTEWTLLTESGEHSTTTPPAATRAVFSVGPDFDAGGIIALRLDSFVLRSPIQLEFQPAIDDFTPREVAPGVTAALDLVQIQSTGAIVRVRLSADMPGATAELGAEGNGPGWVTASSNFGGGGLWTLSFEGSELPDPLPLVIRGVMWIPLDSELVSSLERVPRV